MPPVRREASGAGHKGSRGRIGLGSAWPSAVGSVRHVLIAAAYLAADKQKSAALRHPRSKAGRAGRAGRLDRRQAGAAKVTTAARRRDAATREAGAAGALVAKVRFP